MVSTVVNFTTNLFRDDDLFEDDGTRARAALAHHVLLLAERESGRCARHEKRGEGHIGVRFWILMRARENQVPLGEARVSNPRLREKIRVESGSIILVQNTDSPLVLT